MTPNFLYLVFTVVIIFEGIRGKIYQNHPKRIKHVREVSPPSLLFLLNGKKQTAMLKYKTITPDSDSPILLSSSPIHSPLPFNVLPPSIRNGQFLRPIPYITEASDVPYFGIPPRSFYHPSEQNPQATKNSPAEQSFDDYPSNKENINNFVRKHARPPNKIPEILIDDIETEGYNDQDEATNSFTLHPKYWYFEPVNDKYLFPENNYSNSPARNVAANPFPVNEPALSDIEDQLKKRKKPFKILRHLLFIGYPPSKNAAMDEYETESTEETDSKSSNNEARKKIYQKEVIPH